MTKKPKVWVINMRNIDSSLPIDNGFMAIELSKAGDLSQIPKSRDALRQKLVEFYPNSRPSFPTVKSMILYRFIHMMKKGDVVIFPSKADRTINIGEVTENYQYKKDSSHGYHHLRTVDWKAFIPRNEFTQAALNAIGSAITLFEVENYADEFLKRLSPSSVVRKRRRAAAKSATKETVNVEGVEDDAINDEIATKTTTKKAAETTADFIIKRLKNDLTPYEFEDFTAHLLECMGYYARVTRRSRDGGVDVIAHNDALGFEPPIIKVQCKQVTTKSSEPDVTQLLGTLGEGEFALFVNLGSYTMPAQEREKNREKLRLIGGSELVDLIMENYNKLAPRYRTLLPLKQIYVVDVKDPE